MTTKLALQKILKGIQHTKRKEDVYKPKSSEKNKSHEKINK
jgi:hypothetical protein